MSSRIVLNLGGRARRVMSTFCLRFKGALAPDNFIVQLFLDLQRASASRLDRRCKIVLSALSEARMIWILYFRYFRYHSTNVKAWRGGKLHWKLPHKPDPSRIVGVHERTAPRQPTKSSMKGLRAYGRSFGDN